MRMRGKLHQTMGRGEERNGGTDGARGRKKKRKRKRRRREWG
jgi:hypothetical protein